MLFASIGALMRLLTKENDATFLFIEEVTQLCGIEKLRELL